MTRIRKKRGTEEKGKIKRDGREKEKENCWRPGEKERKKKRDTKTAKSASDKQTHTIHSSAIYMTP